MTGIKSKRENKEGRIEGHKQIAIFSIARGIGVVAEVLAGVCSGGLVGLGRGMGRSEAMD